MVLETARANNVDNVGVNVLLNGLHGLFEESYDGNGVVENSRVAAIDVTLVTQTTLDRAWMIEHLCDRWSGGPIVAVVFIGSKSASKVSSYLRQYQRCALLDFVSGTGEYVDARAPSCLSSCPRKTNSSPFM